MSMSSSSEKSSDILAKPGVHCITGFIHEGEPTGSIVTIAGLETYVAKPKAHDVDLKNAEGKHNKILFYFSDIFGPMYINNKLMMDTFAEHGYLVLGPDYLEGDAYYKYENQPNFDVWSWIDRLLVRAKQITPPWLVAAKAEFGHNNTKYVAAGYCFGAPFVMDLLASEGILAGSFAHPSSVTTDQFASIKGPLLLSCAENDMTFSTEARNKAIQILAEHKARFYLQVFSGVEHGFANKGDMSKAEGRFAKEECLKAFIRWFDIFTA